jgi:hypothetical protein
VIECDGKRIEERHLHFFHADPITPPAPEATEHRDESTRDSEADDESTVIHYLKEQGIINNTVCRQLLNVDRNRSSCLLRKLEKQGTLASERQGRWAQYRLVDV